MLSPARTAKPGDLQQRWQDLRRFYRFLAHYKRWAILAGAAMGLSILLALPVPLLTMYIIDDVLPEKNIERLYWVCGAVFLILLVRTVASLGQQFWFSRLKVLVVARLRLRVLDHLQSLPLRYFQSQPSAYLASRVSSDCEQATQGLLADSLLGLVRQSLTFLFGLFILFALHAKLTALICLLLPFFAFSVVRSNALIRESTSRALEASAQSTATLQQTLSGIGVVKAFAAEKRELIKNLRVLKEAVRATRRSEMISAATSLASDFIGATAPVVLLLYGGLEAISGRLTIGELVAFSSYMGYLFGPIEGIVMLNVIAQGSLCALRRVFELLDTPAEKPGGTVRKKPLRGDLQLRRISFAFEGKQVLNGFDLDIRRGEVVLLTGPSGVGKTTLLYLMAGLLRPDSGCILLDGRDVDEYDHRFLRSQVGLVPQEHLLFSGTVEDNIRYGRPSASRQEVIRAATLANAEEFIRELRKGYETRIGEGGSGLSVGQKQRLCIARALLLRPAVLLLDEPTASVDRHSEQLIQRAVTRLAPTITCVLASHRSSARQIADRIINIADRQCFPSGGSALQERRVSSSRLSLLLPAQSRLTG